MASIDVVTSSLIELMPGYTRTFDVYSPVMEHLVKRGNKQPHNHRQKEFILMPEGPGQVTILVDGDETIRGGRRQSAVRGDAFAGTAIYSVNVPLQDVREANGEADIGKIIKTYPENAMVDFQQRLARQLVMGDGAEVGAFITLNGDATYSPKGTARTGIFQFADESAQTATVFNVAKNSITGWYNGYQHISSVATEGRFKMRKAYWDASSQASDADGDVDVMLSDSLSYDRYIDDLDDMVQIVEKSTKEGDRAPRSVRMGVRFLNGMMYRDPHITPSAFSTANATEGVTYGLHTASWNVFYHGSAKGQGDGNFSLYREGPDNDHDMWKYWFLLSMGMYCDKLRSNFVVTGGNNV